MTEHLFLGMVAETPVHVGIGQAAEALDLPVAREAITGFPHVPGSGAKGAWRVWALEQKKLLPKPKNPDEQQTKDIEQIDQWFGAASGDAGGMDGAGTLLFSEARLAMLPLRCTTDSYKLATCPTIINRLSRDRERMGLGKLDDVSVEARQYLGKPTAEGDNPPPLGLEEREFAHAGDANGVLSTFKALMGDAAPADFADKFIILNDNDFKWFATYGLPVAMRNSLDDNKIVKGGALWSEETLAADSVMWATLNERVTGAIDSFSKELGKKTYIQIGGNETIGQGWFSVRKINGANGNDGGAAAEGEA